MYVCFFCKQKTAYEMRISDWSSDVCSSDLALESYPLDSMDMVGTLSKAGLTYAVLRADKSIYRVKVGNYIGQNFGMITKITDTEEIGRASCRERVCQYV